MMSSKSETVAVKRLIEFSNKQFLHQPARTVIMCLTLAPKLLILLTQS